MPLLDVVLILLIFFAVSTSFINKGLSLDLPTASQSQNNPKGITISLKKNRTIYVEGQKISHSQLKSKLNSLFNKNKNAAVILQADQTLPYQSIVNVLDTIQSIGTRKVLLETQIK